MRISLLIEREPFAEILERTLSEYWQELYQREFEVTWFSRGQSVKVRPGGQEWLANIYLNAIFRPTVDPAAFDPIKREYARSLVAWKAPLQRRYVDLATSRVAKRWFAQARMHVSPAVEDTDTQLIIPGNQKIRLLDHRAGTSTCLLKDGFSDEAFRSEVSARQTASELGVPVPKLEAASERWFREQYVSGTPLNRLESPERVSKFLQSAVSALQLFVSQTQQQVSIQTYVEQLSLEAASYVNRYTPQFCESILERVQHLRSFALGMVDDDHATLQVSQTHGDFQPANVLVRDEEFWLIDWENSALRQTGYDLFVYEFHSRMSDGLAMRMAAAITNDRLGWFGDSPWPGLSWDSEANRVLVLTLFLLEEINWHLKENDNQYFIKSSHGLERILSEAETWQNLQVKLTTASQAC